jgi:murein L,D-transpeptidase YcbB/YkuD
MPIVRLLNVTLLAGLLLAMQPCAASDALDAGIARLLASDSSTLLQRFYAGAAPPRWADDGYAQARQALRLLGAADADGLRPADYAVAQAIPQQEQASPEQRARFEIALTDAVLRYFSDVHGGRTQAKYAVAGLTLPERRFDPVEHLRTAWQAGRLGEAFTAAAPASAQYARVKAALAQYRQLLPRHGQLPPLPALPPGPGLKPGASYPGAAALQARLVLLGDMPAGAPAAASAELYSDELAAALARFQQRHGLLEDGVLGRRTMAALAVPLSQRIRQLELTLERLRWMPPLPPGPLIVVNVPSFRLWGLDTRDPSAPPLIDMRVIVGSAGRTPTPLFLGSMRYLEFNPAWNVPRSIAQGEIIPKLARDPAYLDKQDMELVGAGGQVVPAGSAALALLRADKVRVRQRPGARNVLGAVKFAMPNPMNIYLHSTSAKELFKQTRRDLSHGCIRVEQPAQLAQFVLRGEAGWDSASIAQAMEPGPIMTVRLGAPIPVILFYATALVERSGRVLFLEDVYGHDRQLSLALEAAALARTCSRAAWLA